MLRSSSKCKKLYLIFISPFTIYKKRAKLLATTNTLLSRQMAPKDMKTTVKLIDQLSFYYNARVQTTSPVQREAMCWCLLSIL